MARLERDDRLRIEWYDGKTWRTVEEEQHHGSFARYRKSLAPIAADNDQFAIRFSITGRPESMVYIDLVRVTGELITVADGEWSG